MSHNKVLPQVPCADFNSVELTNSVPPPLIISQKPSGNLWEDSTSAKTMAAAISVMYDSSSARAMSAAVKPMQESPSAKAMAAAISVMNNSSSARAMAAAVKSMQESPSAKAMAAAISVMNNSSSARAMAAAVKSMQESPSAKAMAAAISVMNNSSSARAMATAVKSMQESPSAKAMAAAIRVMDDSSSARAMAAAVKSIKDSPSAKAIAAASSAWLDNSAFKTALAAVRSLEVYPTLSEFKGPTLSLVTWGFTDEVTVGEVLEELATRTNSHVEQRKKDSNEKTQLDDYESRLVPADVSPVDVLQNAVPNHSLNRIPTWALLVWLFVVTPLVFVVVNWESARAGLADLNARLPQTESLIQIRKFIRTELTGKPGDIRLVRGKNVRLREGPGMKADVILLLPPDAIVVVLGKEDKTWLYVSYEHQGYLIDGYLSTRFLKKIKK